jgi:type IV secretion system protein TrbL
MLMLALKIPGIAGALISGGPQLSAGSSVAGAAALAAGVGGVALAGRMAGAMVARGVAQGSAGAAKVGAANAAAGAGFDRAGSGLPSAPGPSFDPGGGSWGGAGAGGSADGGDPGPAPVTPAETLASIRRAPVQILVAAGVRAFSSRSSDNDDTAPSPPPPTPAPADTVAAMRSRRGGVGDVAAAEGARMATQAHEDGGGAGMTPTLHPNDSKSE